MIRAFQWDLARQIEKLDWLLAQLPRYAEWGYQELHLHLEDAVDYPSLPGVARADAFSWRQFERLVSRASGVGIKVVPIVNLLGHTQYLIKTPQWRDLNELRAPNGSALPVGQICPSDPRTLEVAHHLITDVAPFCTAGKVHVGLDESFHLGKHPASRRTIEAEGLDSYFAGYVSQLSTLASAHQLRTALWADMLVLLPGAIPLLPPGLIAYDWYYYEFGQHPRFELHNFQPYDLAPAFRARGLDYWGCPMNGSFRHEPMPVFGERLANAQAWWRRCLSTQAEGFLVTGWEPNRLALETTVVVDAAIAGLWLDPSTDDQVSLLQMGFERVYGKSQSAERARLMLAADERAFTGYARWELNQQWDSVHGRDGVTRFRADERFLQRVATKNFPPAFSTSLRWRSYLATRDRFVREAFLHQKRARRLLERRRMKDLSILLGKMKIAAADHGKAITQGKVAAQAMWRLSRPANLPNPNEVQTRADRQRLRDWQRWISAAHLNPEQVRRASPLGGVWQLQTIVHTLRPALQQIVVQIRDEAGNWRDVHQRYLIEFRSKAARPRTQIRHWLSIPLASPEIPVRFVSRGIGNLALTDTHLTDGIREFRPKTNPARSSKRILLGSEQPIDDFFKLDRQRNQAVWQPDWDHLKTSPK